jgi:hypothetical protein
MKKVKSDDDNDDNDNDGNDDDDDGKLIIQLRVESYLSLLTTARSSTCSPHSLCYRLIFFIETDDEDEKFCKWLWLCSTFFSNVNKCAHFRMIV